MLPIRVDNLSEYLSPPSGYGFDKAVITTYSLHLDILLTIPLFLDGCLNEEDAVIDNYSMIESMISRYRNNIKIYVQKGEIKSSLSTSKKYSQMYELLRDMIVEVKTDTIKSSFHPKFWFIRYKENTSSETYKYRFIVLSKNLTNSADLDIVAVFDSKNITNPNSPYQNINQKIFDFLSKEPINSKLFTQKEITNIEWENIDGFDLEDIYFQSYDKTLYDEKKINENAIIFSPFVSNIIFKEENGNILITREEEVDNSFNAKYFYKINSSLNDQVEDESINTAMFSNEDKDFDKDDLPIINELHAKIYIYKDENNTFFSLGSTNATDRGFERNYEVLVKLKTQGKEFYEDIEKFIKNENKKNPFESFQPKEKDKKANEKNELKKELQDLKYKILSHNWESTLNNNVINLSTDYKHESDVEFQISLISKNELKPLSADLKWQVDTLHITGWFRFVLKKKLTDGTYQALEFLVDTKLDISKTDYYKEIKKEALNNSKDFLERNFEALLYVGKSVSNMTERNSNDHIEEEHCYKRQILTDGKVDLLYELYAIDYDRFKQAINFLKNMPDVNNEKNNEKIKNILDVFHEDIVR